MTSSGTYTFNPSYADFALEAFDRCGIRPPDVTREQMISARRSLNLELAAWSNRGVNLWAVDLQTVSLVQGTATYSVPPETVSVLDVYIETQTGSSDPIDRILSPISRTDYAMIPDKVEQGPPTVYWFDRTLSPTLTLWQPPDGNGPYTLKYYRMRRLQDASPTMGQTADVPYRFLEALCAGLTARLSQKYAPALWAALKLDAKAAWDEAAEEDRERVPLFIAPDLSGYYKDV